MSRLDDLVRGMIAARPLALFNPDQARDDNGRFAAEGASTLEAHKAAAGYHDVMRQSSARSGGTTTTEHYNAMRAHEEAVRTPSEHMSVRARDFSKAAHAAEGEASKPPVMRSSQGNAAKGVDDNDGNGYARHSDALKIAMKTGRAVVPLRLGIRRWKIVPRE